MTELKDQTTAKTKRRSFTLCVCWAVFTLFEMYKINTLYVGHFDCSCIIEKKKPVSK